MQQFATVPTIDPSYHLPPPYAEVLQPEAHPSPAASRTGNVTVTSGCAIAFDTVALHREVRPVACRLGGDCNLVFTGVESATTIRQHLQMAHGIEVRAEGLTQLVRCAWVGEDGTACPATIARVGWPSTFARFTSILVRCGARSAKGGSRERMHTEGIC